MGKDPKKSTEDEWAEKDGKGPGHTQADPKHTQQIDRYDWAGGLREQSYMAKKR